ncbi:hypothetical protein BCR22_02970 [Enterococcus plantarum]|uniref:Acyltransferase 3 domain-containing protein n=1 Tax=Enterococcus plantarum TaxID=1077675 RepID=A0A2W4BF27_9ENTE|nr:acyltransferase family protein [Enterococcus plantarum]OEG13223.1 hypothetical protein BCR22_02970 [Enterococcus plantarum]PZL75355.1 hypothetical protein CI088_05155 [Enterococcus plantarum]
MKEKITKKRESNFELLRILAMLGIIVYHLVIHHSDYNRFALVNLDGKSNFYHLETIQIMYTFGQIGNTLFILITGYFLIGKKNINVLKPGVKLLNRSYLLAIILMGVSYLFGKFQIPLSSNSDIHMALKGWWFIGYYIFIIIFAKYVLNDFLDRLDKKSYLNFILIMTFLLSFMEIFNVLTNLKIQNFVIGILVYSIGGFIRLYNPLQKVKTINLLLCIVSFVAIQIIQYKVNLNTNLNEFYKEPSALFVKSPFINVLWSPSILFMICSVSIFELFSRLKIGSIRLINSVSAATFTVYLFHESYFFRKIQIKGIPLPNRLGILKEVSTKIMDSDLMKGSTVPIDNAEDWINLQDFLNISQVFQDRGVKLGLFYMMMLTVAIFTVGIFFELIIKFINKLFKSIFYSDFKEMKKSLE